MPWRDGRLTVVHAHVGGPQAAAMLEELAALGCRTFLACGGAGGLRRDIAVGHLVVPTSAVRDEGTSYHYLPPAREVELDPEVVRTICNSLAEAGVPYLAGKTWTTDAFFRETPAKVERRRSEGCLTVEMECASFAAAAVFRGLRFGQILYGGDDLSGLVWDSRGWKNRGGIRQGVFELACDAALRI
ncbi:MAG: nucleoside phosphorylase [Clostridiaceae bacterium]|nr:nucleoside phosphorylase [Clostridiaceae bacterium]